MRSRPLPGAKYDTQAIDLYDPVPPAGGGSGADTDADPAGLAVLFVHGGGWYAGARDAYAGWAEHAASLGHPSGSVGYRTDEGSTYHDKRADVLAGWRLLAEEYPAARRVVLVGSSAGAHLVTMLALEERPADLLPLAGVVSMNGPGSMRPENLLQSQERIAQLGLTPDEIDLLDAPVTAAPVPWLFLHAEDETYFPHEHVARLATRLQDAGHSVETVVVPGTKHGFGYRVLERDDEQAALSERSVAALWARAAR